MKRLKTKGYFPSISRNKLNVLNTEEIVPGDQVPLSFKIQGCQCSAVPIN
jgi:hypothetical protein